VQGLGDEGFAFINTSNLEGNPGYPGRRLGGAVLALNTVDLEDIMVSWEAGTVEPNSREYALRLQYRIGNKGVFHDVTDSDGNPHVYVRSDTAGHRKLFGPLKLPEDCENKPHVELLWRYYHTGMRIDPDNGARSMLHIPSITVEASRDTGEGGDDPVDPDKPRSFYLGQNYPNPFNSQTRIPFKLDERSRVIITVHDITGRQVVLLVDREYPAGWHTVTFDGSDLASGVYMYRLAASGTSQTRSMTLVR
jgi:hypothetical protein